MSPCPPPAPHPQTANQPTGIGEQHPVEMIDLVLEDAREQVTAPHHDTAPRGAPPLDLDPLRPADLAVDSWDAETAFDADLGALAAPHARVHHGEGPTADV